MRPALVIFLLFACAWLGGCANGPHYIPDDDSGSTAPGAAYAAEGMMIRKDSPDHSDFKRWQFYYKHCALNGDDNDFSGRGYDCSGPFY